MNRVLEPVVLVAASVSTHLDKHTAAGCLNQADAPGDGHVNTIERRCTLCLGGTRKTTARLDKGRIRSRSESFGLICVDRAVGQSVCEGIFKVPTTRPACAYTSFFRDGQAAVFFPLSRGVFEESTGHMLKDHAGQNAMCRRIFSKQHAHSARACVHV